MNIIKGALQGAAQMRLVEQNHGCGLALSWYSCYSVIPMDFLNNLLVVVYESTINCWN